jgi:tetratricopeptide (TPR) repeat protein
VVADPEGSQGASMHAVDPESQAALEALRKEVLSAKAGGQQGVLYEKLAKMYLTNHQYDSAGWYFEKSAGLSSKPELKFAAGSAYFEGIAFASNTSKVDFLSDKARALLEQIPEGHPKKTEAEAKSALTWVNSPNPMKGILKLRALAEKEPQNLYVAYQLGMLSYQSGQYEKAIGRFQKVVAGEKENVNAWFYLAQSLMQTGKKSEALEALEAGLPFAKEEDTKASFQELKKQLTEN